MRLPNLPRPVVVGGICFLLFVFLDLTLFGWLIFRSLSAREITKLVSETRRDAEEVAGQIALEAERRGSDLGLAVATNEETRTYIDSVLARREIVEMVEVLDKERRVVYRGLRAERFDDGQEGASDSGLGHELEGLPNVITEQIRSEVPYEIVEVPVGNLGTFVIGIRREEVEARLGELRLNLLRQAAFIAALTLILLGAASSVMVLLVRRTRHLEAAAKDAERLAYIGTLAAGLAHEVRSPLNSLNLNMQMLEEELATQTSGDTPRLVRITRSEISRLERLVSDFLRYARPRPLERREVPARELLEHVHEVMRGKLIAADASLRITDRSGDQKISVDVEQMSQLLLNLVENGLQSAAAAKRAPSIELGCEIRDDVAVLWTSDNGVGMTNEEIERATELFFSQRRGGTGLGLAVADRIARAHEGRIEFTSELGEGARAEVLLPLLRAVG